MTILDYVLGFLFAFSAVTVVRNICMVIMLFITYYIFTIKDQLDEESRNRIMDELCTGASVIGLALSVIYFIMRFW